MSIRKIKDHLSEINNDVKNIDPNEENPSLNSILESVKGAEEELRKLLFNIEVLEGSINELKD